MSKNSDNKIEITPKEWLRKSCQENKYYKARNFLKELLYKCYWKDGEFSATAEELDNYMFIDSLLEAGVKEHLDHLKNWFKVTDEQINEITTN